MTNKQSNDSMEEIKSLIVKQLILDLFNLNISQQEIAKKLKIDVHTVNDFLKGLKKEK